jgi:hypothetical protein
MELTAAPVRLGPSERASPPVRSTIRAASRQGIALNPRRQRFLLVNLLGGVAVLGSYAWGLATHPSSRHALWGGVPVTFQGAYTVSMFTAAAGYFAFASWFAFRVDPERSRFFGGRTLDAVTAIFALILVTAALWMPLTFHHLGTPRDTTWLAVRIVLALTGAGSLSLFAALFTTRPRASAVHLALAALGLAAFCFQTAFLDAVIWTAYFPA